MRDSRGRKLTILYHHRTRAEDAQGVHIASLCKAFQNLGHKVHLVSLVRQTKNGQVNPQKARVQGNSIANFQIPHWLYELLAIGYNFPAMVKLGWAVMKENPDFIYERYSLFNFSGKIIAGLFRIPFILEVNAPLSLEMQAYEKLFFKSWAQKVEDWLCKSATKTIVVSSVMKDIFTHRGLPADRFIVIPNAIDRRMFHPGVNGKEVRHQYGLHNKFVLGFVGWVRLWHGIEFVLQAIARLVKEIPHLHFLLVGDGPAIPALQKQVTQLKIEDYVTFTGPVEREKIPEYIAAFDIALQPDVTEYASPIKLFEYLAMAKPIIAPDKNNIREIVENGKQALLYTPGDVQQMSELISLLYRDELLRKSLAEAGLRLIHERGYFWENNAQKVIDLIRKNTDN